MDKGKGKGKEKMDVDKARERGHEVDDVKYEKELSLKERRKVSRPSPLVPIHLRI